MRPAILIILAMAICSNAIAIVLVPDAQRLGFVGVVAGTAILGVGLIGSTMHEQLGGFVRVALVTAGIVLGVLAGGSGLSEPMVLLSSFLGAFLGPAILIWAVAGRRVSES